MAKHNHYPEAAVPFLCALIKSRKGKLDESQSFLDHGKTFLSFQRNKFIFSDFFIGKVVVTHTERLKLESVNKNNENSNQAHVDNYLDWANEMTRKNGIPSAFAPFLQRLITSRNGNLEEAHHFLDIGRYIFKKNLLRTPSFPFSQQE